MGTHTAHKPSQLFNMPASFAPMLFADPSYFDANRAPVSSAQADGYRFIAKLGRVFRAHS